GISSLRGVTDAGAHVVIGALARHADVAASDLVRSACPILAQTAAGVGDMQVRNRGTIGGSLAQADPHGDLPTVLLALDGDVSVEGPDGTRTVAARDLFLGFLTTSLQPDEILTGVRVPKAAHGAYVKFNRRAQDWAIVGVAAVVDGASARIALTGVGPRPVRAEAAESAFTGANAAEAAEHAAEGLTPPADAAGSSEYRKHLVRVLTRRALEEAVAG
ncbi:MAG TPA: FAD binding domain-containing protein, partial [Gaiellales bacterium]